MAESTRPPSMSQEQVDRLAEKIAARGGSITITDPRVTNAQTWILGTVGMIAIGVGAWGIQAINELNQTMTRVVTQNENTARVLEAHARQLERHDDRIRAVEARR